MKPYVTGSLQSYTRSSTALDEVIIGMVLAALLSLLSISITLFSNTGVFDRYTENVHNKKQDDTSKVAASNHNVARLSLLPKEEQQGSRKGNPGVNTLSSTSPEQGQ